MKQMNEAPAIRLMPSLRERAEKIAAQEGVAVDEWINVAVAESVASFEQAQWLKRKLSAVKSPAETSVAEALTILRRPDSRPPDPGDELPEGYVPIAATHRG